MRIVSTVPSQTELLYDLGLDVEVVGITKFCVHPDSWYRSKTRVGGTKTLDVATIQSLQPDWILANKEENVKEQIEACAAFAQVYVSDVYDLPSALQMIADIGGICEQREAATQLSKEITEGFSQLEIAAPKTVVYLIWKDPVMSVGQDTFIHDMIQRNGWTNLMGAESRYPSIEMGVLQGMRPDLLLLSSEPYPFGAAHVASFQQLLPDTDILLVDGTYFSWYGSRLKESAGYFEELQGVIAAL